MDARTTGDEVGGYTIVSRLGAGAAGTVYRAHDGAQEQVALKILHPAYAATADARERLAREVAAMHRLSHPGIARVLDAETDSEEAFLVTELVDGPSLEDEVMGGGPLDAADLYELALRLFEALGAVHEAGLVHRDVKPSNVLIGPEGPVLIDFGIAQEMHDARLTSHGFVMGTPGYLAPEMLDGGAPGAGADWWGWAGALVYAATGRAPFGVRPLEQVLSRVREGAVDLDGLGPITRDALGGALRPDPADRLPPEEVVARLGEAAAAGELLDGAVPATRAFADDHAGTAVLPGRTASAMTRDVPLDLHGTGAPGQREYDAGPPAVVPPATVPFDGAAPHGEAPYGGAAYGEAPYGGAVGGQEVGEGFDEGPLYERPRYPHRPFAVLALAVPTVLAAGLYPAVTGLVVLGVLLVLRTVAVTTDALHGRREVHGVRRSDPWRHGLLLPWYVLRAAAGLVPSVLVSGSASVIVLGVLWWLLQTDRWILSPAVGSAGADVIAPGSGNADWVFLATLCVTAVVTLLLLWFGPLTRLTREGARVTLAALAPGRWGTAWVAVLGFALTALFVLWIAVGKLIVWWPFGGPPDLS